MRYKKRESAWHPHGTGEGILRCRIDEVKCLIKISIVKYIDLREVPISM